MPRGYNLPTLIHGLCEPPAKNFLKANIRELRQMQARNRQKDMEAQQERQQQTPVKPLHSEKYRRVRSKVAAIIKGSSDSAGSRRGHSLTSLDKLQHRSCESGLGASRTPSPDPTQPSASNNNSSARNNIRQISQSMAEMSLGALGGGDDTPLATPTQSGAPRVYNRPTVSVGTSTDDFWCRSDDNGAKSSVGGSGKHRGATISDREEMVPTVTAGASGVVAEAFPLPSASSSCQTDRDADTKLPPLLPPTASTIMTPAKPTRSGKIKEDPNKAPSAYQKGVVPRYLRDRQEGWKQEESRRQEEEAIHQACPPGHIPVSDKERLETLHLLKTSYEKLIKELNSMPLCKDTVRIRQRKVEIEKQLVKLEEGIKVFSRPKVFIKVDS